MRTLLLLLALAVLGIGGFFLLGTNDGAARGEAAGPERATPGGTSAASRALEAPDVAPTTTERVGVAEEAGAPVPATEARSAPATQGVRVTGRCVDREERPVPDVRVDCRGASVVTDAEGRFAFTLALDQPVALLDVAFRKDGWADVTLELEAWRGELADAGDVVLDGAAVVSGRVTDGTGAPIAEAEVQLEEALSVASGSRFQGADEPLRRGTTDVDGRFRLERVAPGPLRVWAGKRDFVWATSDPHDLVVGEEHEVELVLAPLAAEDVIDLLVVDPDGAPVPNARLQYRYEVSGRSGSSTTSAGEDGRHRVFCAPRAPRSFLASHPEDRFGAAVAEDVPPGTRDLVLRLTPLETFALAVSEPDGTPVTRYVVRLEPVDPRAGSLPGTRDSAHRAEGRVDLAKPPFAFHVEVEAPGFDLARLGPFEPAGVRDVVFVELRPLPRMRGRVTSFGTPVEGATVSLHRARGEGGELEINGFRCRSHRSQTAGGSTGPDGTFVVTLHAAGRYYVRAARQGYATTDAGPFDLDPALGAEGLDVELGRGGTVAGRVLTNAHQPKEGWIVGASRGDGFGTTTRTDADGAFRFEGLAAGPWLVEQREDEISPGSTSSGTWTTDDVPPLAFNCTVREGTTTSFDLDLRDLEDCVVVGRLLLDGAAPAGSVGWTAHLTAEADEVDESRSASLDSHGRFRLTARTPGRYALRLTSEQGTAFVEFREELDLPGGETPWERDVATGRLEGTATGDAVDWRSALRYAWEEGALRYEAHVTPAEGGAFAVSGVPAGVGRLSLRTADGTSSERPATVPEGGVATVQLP